MFDCDKCGLCCMNIDKSDIYSDLDRGDGVCKYYNELSHLCNIYDNRPDICNIDKMYEIYFCTTIAKEDYYQMNYNACKQLKKNKNEE